MTFHDQMFTREGIQALGHEWFDCEIPSWLASRWSCDYADAHKIRNQNGTAEDVTATFPYVFLKMRLLDFELLPVAERAPAAAPIVTAVFHIGFVRLRESLEMWQRLWNEEIRPDCDMPARSRMFTEMQKISPTPIDATAAIVSKAK
jgi:hypothetical protein